MMGRVRRLAVLGAALAVGCVACGGSPAPVQRAHVGHAPGAAPRAPVHLVERSTGTLPAPLQDPSAAAVGAHRVVLLGGLTAADSSADGILLTTPARAHAIGTLPSARHDTAAVALGGSVYLFGGGTATAQLDEILRVDPASGRVSLAGRLPAASSDSAAAAIGGTAYVFGGY